MPGVNVGTLPNDLTGDSFRTGWQIINRDLYATPILSQANVVGVYNVKAYGAVGDGATNDYTAIQAARTAATTWTIGNFDSPVYFPPGIYNCSPALPFIPYHQNVLVGAGRECTVLRGPAGGGPIIDWTGTSSHPSPEFACGIYDMSVDSNGASTGTTISITDLTLMRMERLFINNGSTAGYAALNTCAGLKLVSIFDSDFHDIYVSNCGGGGNNPVTLDTTVTGSGTLNNCQFYNLHIEVGPVDAIFLNLVGNATSPITDLRFFGLKIHGDPATSNPATNPLLKLSQYVQACRFFGTIIAFGHGTAQLITDGARNSWHGIDFGIGSTPPTYAIQCTANANTQHFFAPNFKTNTYGTAFFRAEGGSVHCGVFQPQFNGGTLLSDAGRSVAIYENISSNAGTILYAADGITVPVFTQTVEYLGTLTDAATIAVNAGGTNAYQVTLTASGHTMGIPSSPATGQTLKFTIIQDGTGGRTLLWNAVYKVTWSDTGNTLNKRSTIMFQYDGTNWNQMGAQSPYV